MHVHVGRGDVGIESDGVAEAERVDRTDTVVEEVVYEHEHEKRSAIHARAYANRRQVFAERQEEPTKGKVSYIKITADLTLTYSTEMGIVLSEAKARFIELYRSSCSAVIRRKHCR